MAFDFSQLPPTDLWQTANKAKEVVLYGTGDGADKIIDRLNRDGTRINAVCSSSGFVRNRIFRGYPVLSAEEAAKTYPNALFLLAFGTNRPEVIAELLHVAERVELRCATVPVYGREIFDLTYLQQNREKIDAAFSLLQDRQSEKVFTDALLFFLTGSLPLLFDADSEKTEVFDRILQLNDREHYLDVGAYRGDTAEEFVRAVHGSYASITLLEPDKKNFEKLKANLSSYKNTTVIHAGAWECNTVLPVETGRGKGSRRAQQGIPTDFVCLDSLNTPVTYLKIDAEGAEKEILDGAKHLLQTEAPKLNLAAYHRTGDLFRLILRLHEINPHYEIYLRKHCHIPFWDLNIYARTK